MVYIRLHAPARTPAMKTDRLIVCLLAAATLAAAAPAFALTPSQSSSAAAKARSDATLRARFDAETKARLDALTAARMRADAAAHAQKKAAIEFVLRNQAAAAKLKSPAETRHAYMVANPSGLAKSGAGGQAVAPAPGSAKSGGYRHGSVGSARTSSHAAGHSR